MNILIQMLNQLIERSQYSQHGDFSITKSDDGWYAIAVGEHRYMVNHFTEEKMFEALVNIMASIKAKEQLKN